MRINRIILPLMAGTILLCSFPLQAQAAPLVEQPMPQAQKARQTAETPLDVERELEVKVGEYDKLKVFLGLQTAGRVQSLSQMGVFMTTYDSTNRLFKTTEPNSLARGAGTSVGNLVFLANYDDKVQVYADFFLASVGHASQTYGGQGFILITGTPENLKGTFLAPVFNAISLKTGFYEVSYGDALYHRSYNGNTMRNPFIGNFVVDPFATEVGAEIISKPGTFNWLIGAGSGTTPVSYSRGTGISGHAKMWLDLERKFQVSLSLYTDNQSRNPNQGATPTGSQGALFNSNRSGEAYAGVLGGALGTTMDVTPGHGELVSAGQLDVTWKPDKLHMYANIGYTMDADTNGGNSARIIKPSDGDLISATTPPNVNNPYSVGQAYVNVWNSTTACNGGPASPCAGSPKDQWLYYAAEAVYHFSDVYYVGLRYSGAQTKQLYDIRTSGQVDRQQLAFGYYITRNLLFKVEAVHEAFSRFQNYREKLDYLKYFGGVDWTTATNGWNAQTLTFNPDVPVTPANLLFMNPDFQRIQKNPLFNQIQGVDSWRNPVVNGVLVELTFAF